MPRTHCFGYDMGPWAHVGAWARAPGPGALGPLSPQVAPPDPGPGPMGPHGPRGPYHIPGKVF